MKDSPVTLGRIAYNIYTETLGKRLDWDGLRIEQQIAWNEAAVCIRNSHHFLSNVEETQGRVVEEFVDGGGIGARGGMATNVEKDGTG